MPAAPEAVSVEYRSLPTPPAVGTSCISVDVEEYFQCEVFARKVRIDDWPRFARRGAPFVERLADLVEEHGSRATFFVLGWLADSLAPLLRDLARRGHELACHGFAHQHLGRLSPAQFRADLRRARAALEDAVGARVCGYRAPTFSVMRQTAWALDVLAEEGFDYDASIYPIHHDRYGVPDAPLTPFWAEGPGGGRVLEFPPLTVRCGPLHLPFGGGGYLRLLPGSVMRHCVRRAAARGQPVMLYVHPWELDPDQPRIPVGPLAQWRHRVNLRTTEAKLRALLRETHFDPACAVLAAIIARGKLPTFRLAPV